MLRLLLSMLLAAPLGAAGEPGGSYPGSDLAAFVRQDCGACHGLRLTGGLGPSLEPRTLAEKDTDFLVAVILHGRRGTAMPAWKSLLSETDAQRIAELLKKGLPK